LLLFSEIIVTFESIIGRDDTVLSLIISSTLLESEVWFSADEIRLLLNGCCKLVEIL
jgi:hypothetical protein